MKIIVSAGDAATAKLIQKAGMDGIWVSSFECSCRLGIPDDGSIGLVRMMDICKPIARAVNIPVYVDVDTGYSSFQYTVERMENIGVAGVCVKDTVECQNSIWRKDGELLSQDDFLKKIDVKHTLKIIARTEAIIIKEKQEFVEGRIRRYAEVADIMLPHVLKVKDIYLPMGYDKKFAIVPTLFPWIPQSFFELFGYDMVIWANQMERMKLAAAMRCLKSIIKFDGASQVENFAISLKQLRDL